MVVLTPTGQVTQTTTILLHHIDMFTKAKQKHKERQIMIMIMYSFMCYFLQIGTTSLLQSTEPKHSKNTTKKRRKKKKGNSAMGIYQSFFLKQNLSFVGFCCGKKQRQTDKQTNTTSRQAVKLTHSTVRRNRDRQTSRPTRQAGRHSNSHIIGLHRHIGNTDAFVSKHQGHLDWQDVQTGNMCWQVSAPKAKEKLENT